MGGAGGCVAFLGHTMVPLKPGGAKGSWTWVPLNLKVGAARVVVFNQSALMSWWGQTRHMACMQIRTRGQDRIVACLL